jgi:hypothetical protein
MCLGPGPVTFPRLGAGGGPRQFATRMRGGRMFHDARRAAVVLELGSGPGWAGGPDSPEKPEPWTGDRLGGSAESETLLGLGRATYSESIWHRC